MSQFKQKYFRDLHQTHHRPPEMKSSGNVRVDVLHGRIPSDQPTEVHISCLDRDAHLQNLDLIFCLTFFLILNKCTNTQNAATKQNTSDSMSMKTFLDSRTQHRIWSKMTIHNRIRTKYFQRLWCFNDVSCIR